MGWYFRKSLNLGGGLRLNLSKSGIGMSSGIRGLRFGVSPNGRQYVHCGAGGIYYAKSFGGAGSRPQPHYPAAVPPVGATVGPQHVIASGNVAQMVDASAGELMAEIRRRHGRLRLHRWCLSVAAALFIFGALQQQQAVVVTAVVLLAAVPLLWLVDKCRKTIELTYHLDPVYERRYRGVVAAFCHFCSAHRIWHVQSHAAVANSKYHAGASSIINRTAIAPRLRLPPYFRSNINPPMLPAGRQTLYLLPDTILVFQGGKVGSVAYHQLALNSGITQFIEDGSPPRDSRQVGQTWRYVNKSGGPDRRFSNNRPLPIMSYGIVRWQSATGLNEEYQVSREDVCPPLESQLRQMSHSIPTNTLAPVAHTARPQALPRQPWPTV